MYWIIASDGLPTETKEAFDKVTDAIAGELQTERQRQAFQAMRQNRWDALSLQIERHTASQIRQYTSDELEGSLKNDVDLAIRNAQNPQGVQQYLTSATNKLTAFAAQLGKGPEETEAAVRDIETRVHTGVIANLLDNKLTGKARAYYEEAKDQIASEKHGEIEKALKVGDVQTESRVQAAKIQATGGTLKEQIAAAESIADADVYDATVQRLRMADSVNKADKLEQDRAYLDDVYARVTRRPSLDALSPTDITRLGTDLPGVLSYMRARAAKVPTVNNDTRYYELSLLAAKAVGGDKAATTEFSQLNLMRDRGRLDDGHFDHLVSMQGQVIAGNTAAAREAAAKFGDSGLVNQTFNDTWARFTGIDSTPTKEQIENDPTLTKRIATMRELVRAEVAMLPKVATAADVQSVVDRIFSVSTTATTPGSLWNFWPGGQPMFDETTTMSIADMTIRNVPAKERTQIEAALKAAGEPANDVTILNRYLVRLMRGGGK